MTDEKKKEILEMLKTIETSSYEDIDQAFGSLRDDIMLAYKFRLMTDFQRKVLSRYREKRLEIKNKLSDEKLMGELKRLSIEFNIDTPEIFQFGRIEGRIVVCAYQNFIENKENKKRSIGPVYEIYRDRTPDSYEYALIKFSKYENL